MESTIRPIDEYPLVFSVQKRVFTGTHLLRRNHHPTTTTIDLGRPSRIRLGPFVHQLWRETRNSILLLRDGVRWLREGDLPIARIEVPRTDGLFRVCLPEADFLLGTVRPLFCPTVTIRKAARDLPFALMLRAPRVGQIEIEGVSTLVLRLDSAVEDPDLLAALAFWVNMVSQ